MRKRKLLVALAGLAVVGATGVVVLWLRPSRVTQANFDRIQAGMSRAEVDAILGPPSDCSTGPLVYGPIYSRVFSSPGPHPPHDYAPRAPILFSLKDGMGEFVEWRSDSQIICVYFYRTGEVQSKGWYDVTRTDQSTIENLLWRVKRHWHRCFPE
jgi:hypothetical protein